MPRFPFEEYLKTIQQTSVPPLATAVSSGMDAFEKQRTTRAKFYQDLITKGYKFKLNGEPITMEIADHLARGGNPKKYPGLTYDPPTIQYTALSPEGQTLFEKEIPKGSKVEMQKSQSTGYIDPETKQWTPLDIPTGAKIVKQPLTPEEEKKKRMESPEGIRLATSLRKEFSSLTKNYRSLNQKLANAKSVYEDVQKRELAGEKVTYNALDQAIVISFNKYLDPGSVVRESEFARTPENAPMINKAKSLLPQAQKGGLKLTDADRQDFLRALEIMAREQGKYYDAEKTYYGNLANQYGISIDQVLGADYNFSEKQTTGGKPGGRLMIDAQGNKAMVYPDGSYEEVK